MGMSSRLVQPSLLDRKHPAAFPSFWVPGTAPSGLLGNFHGIQFLYNPRLPIQQGRKTFSRFIHRARSIYCYHRTSKVGRFESPPADEMHSTRNRQCQAIMTYRVVLEFKDCMNLDRSARKAKRNRVTSHYLPNRRRPTFALQNLVTRHSGPGTIVFHWLVLGCGKGPLF